MEFLNHEGQSFPDNCMLAATASSVMEPLRSIWPRRRSVLPQFWIDFAQNFAQCACACSNPKLDAWGRVT